MRETRASKSFKQVNEGWMRTGSCPELRMGTDLVADNGLVYCHYFSFGLRKRAAILLKQRDKNPALGRAKINHWRSAKPMDLKRKITLKTKRLPAGAVGNALSYGATTIIRCGLFWWVSGDIVSHFVNLAALR
jgi:hypothetical protein